MSFRKAKGYKLRKPPVEGEFLHDFMDAEKFGLQVDFLIPCLSSKTTVAQKKDSKLMSNKWVNS